MKIYRLDEILNLPIPIAEAWEFLSNPASLSRITPEWMEFAVTSELPERMYAGLIITYRIRPIMGIPATWVTEITHLREPDYFVDEQRAGPYRFWHHQHILEEIDCGTAMRDIVHYALPFGLLGRMAHPFLVRPKLQRIFAFRRRKLEEMFGTWGGGSE